MDKDLTARLGQTTPLGPPVEPGAGVGTAEATQPTLDQTALPGRLGERGAVLPWPHAQRFRVDQPLGAGANGRIYSVRDQDLDRPVALKTFSLAGAGDADRLRSFISEARMMATLQHPNVAPIYDIGVDRDGDVYFTMKQIEGLSLADLIAQSTPESRHERISTANQVVSIAIGVCSALAFAHHHRIIHQDVKPSNIMVGAFGEVLLIDWGSAVRLDDPSDRNRLYATPLYMAPEQARRQQPDARSDVYCMGATLFHTLLLRLPTQAEDEETLWKKKKAGTIDRPSDEERRRVPAALLAIAMKALNPDPDARYQDASAMLKDLQDYQAGLAVAARPESLLERLMRWYRRNRRLVWLSTVSIVIIAAVSSLLAVEKAKERARWRVVYDSTFAGMAPKAIEESWAGTISENARDAFSSVPIDSPAFAVDDRGLIIHGTIAGYVDLAFRGDLVGDVRVEWDYTCDRQNLNYNCFIGGQNRWSSHMFHVGSWLNPAYVALTHGKDYSVLDSDFLADPLVPGRTYRFAMEQEAGRLRLSIDDHVIFDLDNPADVYGDHSNTFGFDAVGFSDLRIRHVRVLHKPLPQKISPLVVADKLLQIPDYPRAAQHYLDIMKSYPGTDLARVANFRYGICSLRTGDTKRACAELERLAAEHPDDPETPYALFELLKARNEQGDKRAVADLLERCVRWKHHPVLARVMAEIADSHMGELQRLPTSKPGDPEYRPDVVECIRGTIAELQTWGRRYEVAWWKNTYAFVAGDVLRALGAGADVIAQYPKQSLSYQQALGEAGRFEELLAIAPVGSGPRAQALLGLGRQDEVVSGGHYPEVIVWETLAKRGDLPKLLSNRDLAPSQWAKTLLIAGKYEEALEQPADPKTIAAILIALGRPEEIEKRTNDAIAVSRALVELKQYDLLVHRYPTAYENLYLAAERQWFAGDHAAAEQLLADLEHAQVPLEISDTMFGRYVFPGFIRVLTGRTEAAAEFAPLLARCHDWYGQTLWYQLAYLAGKVDDQGFRAQPDHDLLEERLLLTQAMSKDLHGDRAGAAAAYTRFAALPCFLPVIRECDRDFVRWRIRELGGR